MNLPLRIVFGVLAYIYCMLAGAMLGSSVAVFAGYWRGTGYLICVGLGVLFGAFVAWRGRVFQYRRRS